jgi:hypothetical protein
MRKSVLVAVAVAALSSTAAFAQGSNNSPATRQPTPLERDNRTYNYDDRDETLPPAADNRAQRDERNSQSRPQTTQERQASIEDERRRDLFCRRDAARRTGYTTPAEAARDEQARGTIGGTLGGAALGAIIGGASGNAGAGAAIGAGAGLVAGSAIGADNARRAASDIEAEYGDAYYACMDTAQDDVIEGERYAADYPAPPPPPVYYAPRPYPYYAPYPRYYGPRFYGPSFGLSFGFGSGYRGGFYGPRRGFGRRW